MSDGSIIIPIMIDVFWIAVLVLTVTAITALIVYFTRRGRRAPGRATEQRSLRTEPHGLADATPDSTPGAPSDNA